MKNRFLKKILVAGLIICAVPMKAKLSVQFFYMMLYDIFLRRGKQKELNEVVKIFDGNQPTVYDTSGCACRISLHKSYLKNKHSFEFMLATDPEVKDFADLRNKHLQELRRKEIQERIKMADRE